MPSDPTPPKPRQAPQHDYTGFCQRVLRGGLGPWLGFPASFLKVLSARETALVLWIINRGKLNADELGWVLISPRILETALHLPAHVQERVLRRLVGMGILQIHFIGKNKFARVDVFKLADLVLRAPAGTPPQQTDKGKNHAEG